ncbi:hypothetical protein EDB92DRAFT_1880223 [Lactarius akahatsu]|uniref:Uncharacterized protein n=1 Tax=Lactarius akahatsu TaxID=416441 RepID=A0AAD4QB46_9AGAM|nr:hypothetical protein EDB92DRAFT_1880223 [Lactarius akahatsu]
MDTTTDTATATTATTDGPPPPTLTLTMSAPRGPLEYLKPRNGRSLCFKKQSVPDPLLVSFAKDLPWLVRTWDDSSPEWSPLAVVFYIQGELITLKHWPTVCRYGKPS